MTAAYTRPSSLLDMANKEGSCLTVGELSLSADKDKGENI